MINLCIIGARMDGFVPHHAGHIIGYSGGSPIYCSGHDVIGYVKDTPQIKYHVHGILAAVLGASGPSTDPCDQSNFYCVEGSKSVFIQGKPAVMLNHKTALNPGDGKMTIANQNKVFIRR